MNFGLDGLSIGPAVMNWGNLSLMLGLLTWLGLAKFPQAQAVALFTLMIARLWAALPGWTTQRPLLDNVWDILDLRRGNWAWLPGITAGFIYILFETWRDVKRTQAQANAKSVIPAPWLEITRTSLLPVALQAALPALVMGALPLLLKPAMNHLTLPNHAKFTHLDGTPATLPRPAVINLWATWCGPCRSEIPLLLSEAQRDPHLILLNVGENSHTVQKFLNASPAQVRPKQIWLGGQNVTSAMRVTGFPTTLVINSSGQVIARHLGPLTRAQLLELQRQAKETP